MTATYITFRDGEECHLTLDEMTDDEVFAVDLDDERAAAVDAARAARCIWQRIINKMIGQLVGRAWR